MNASCTNLEGAYTCSCSDGFIDNTNDVLIPGRNCSGKVLPYMCIMTLNLISHSIFTKIYINLSLHAHSHIQRQTKVQTSMSHEFVNVPYREQKKFACWGTKKIWREQRCTPQINVCISACGLKSRERRDRTGLSNIREIIGIGLDQSPTFSICDEREGRGGGGGESIPPLCPLDISTPVLTPTHTMSRTISLHKQI